MKKALIVSPYLDHLGGGERYMLSVASVLETMGHKVYFAWDKIEDIKSLSSMLGIKLNDPLLDPKIKKLYFKKNPLSMYTATKPYDVVVYLSDGSIPWLGAKRNIVHLQVPFHGVGGRMLKNQLKKRFIDYFIVNSKFTKEIVDIEYKINSIVVYPPVKGVIHNTLKENIILSVGRFEPSINAKRHDVLIDAMKALSPSLPGWKLVLAGASSSDKWLSTLKERAKGFPIEFLPNISHEDLAHLYSKSTLYWHAAGFGVNPTKNPELTEHFGISTVEAASAGCIPLVVPSGGQAEIVTPTDLHWKSIDELVEKTQKVINILGVQRYLSEIKIDGYTEEAFAANFGKLVL